uniref:Uncharacterized protein n=1 Tax=Arundo donax TaxID=35708 RepID=A0A0A9EHV1_ARUDO
MLKNRFCDASLEIGPIAKRSRILREVASVDDNHLQAGVSNPVLRRNRTCDALRNRNWKRRGVGR